jgi:serine/threonine protein kinase
MSDSTALIVQSKPKKEPTLQDAILDCQKLILRGLVTRTFGNANHAFSYLRQDHLEIATQRRIIQSVVNLDTSFTNNKVWLVQNIRRRARRMFLVCIDAGLNMNDLHAMIMQGYTDRKLPFSIDTTGKTPPACLQTFMASQWFVRRPPTLVDQDFMRQLSLHAVVPIAYNDTAPIGGGNAGRVYEARIDTKYYKIPDLWENIDTPGLSMRVALKVARITADKNTTEDAGTTKDQTAAEDENATEDNVTADNEVTPDDDITAKDDKISEDNDSETSRDSVMPDGQALRERHFLSQRARFLMHDHIAKVHANFLFKNQAFLVSKLANTDLRGLMMSYPDPRSMVDMTWLRKQMIGLTDALANIHRPIKGHTAYHHDINTSNILVFETNNEYRLAFTDWGCAEVKRFRRRESIRGDTRGQFPSLPPESSKGVNLQQTSRPHDVWSLGVVFVQMLVWFYQGNVARSTLYTSIANSNTGGFGNWFEENQTGERVFHHLAATMLMNMSGISPNMATVVKIIREMFIIEPKDRITAEELHRQLDLVAIPW